MENMKNGVWLTCFSQGGDGGDGGGGFESQSEGTFAQGAQMQDANEQEGLQSQPPKGGTPQYHKAQEEQNQQAIAAADEPIEQMKSSFEELIKGDYKEDFQQKVDQIIARRFAKQKGMEQELERYKGYDGFIEGLQKRQVDFKNPTTFFETFEKGEAMNKGSEYGENVMRYAQRRNISPGEAKNQLGYMETLMEIKRNRAQEAMEKRHTEKVTKALEQMRHEKMYRQNFNHRIKSEVATTQNLYGATFNMNREMGNDAFRNLIKAGVPVQKAFEVVHQEMLVGSALEKAVAETRKRVAGTMAAKNRRPTENGMTTARAGTRNFDPQRLTNQAVREIERRVAKGEKIGPGEMLAYMK